MYVVPLPGALFLLKLNLAVLVPLAILADTLVRMRHPMKLLHQGCLILAVRKIA